MRAGDRHESLDCKEVANLNLELQASLTASQLSSRSIAPSVALCPRRRRLDIFFIILSIDLRTRFLYEFAELLPLDLDKRGEVLWRHGFGYSTLGGKLFDEILVFDDSGYISR